MSDERAKEGQADTYWVPTASHARPRGIRSHGSLATGLALILIGVIFLLDELRIVDFRLAFDAWPLFIVIFGLARMIDSRDRSSGLWLVAIGLWLFVNEWELWGLTYGDSWPLLVVVFGISMVFKALRGSHTPPAKG